MEESTSYNFVSDPGTITVTPSVGDNLRSMPSTTGSPIWVVPHGSTFPTTGYVSNGSPVNSNTKWWKVGSAYLSDVVVSFVANTPPVPTPTPTPTPTPVPTSPIEFGFASNAFSVELNSAQRATWAADFKALGVNWVRFDCVWSEMEPSSGTFNWYLDQVVDDAVAAGLQVLLILDSPSGIPGWAGGGMPKNQAEATAYGAWAGEVAGHYIPKGVLAYEIWNEPNGGNWPVAPATYVEMLKSAYPAIKAQTNGANTTVLGGGGVCPGGSLWGVQYIQALYQGGAKGFFDAISWHPYVYNDTPYGEDPADYTGDPSWAGMSTASLNAVALMTQYGDSGKKIWVTEFGAPSNVMTEAQQANQLAAAIKDWKSYPWAGNFFLYTYLTNQIPAGGNESFFGIVENASNDGVTKSGNKAAYAAIQTAIA